MPIVPSLLEYSEQNLLSRIQTLNSLGKKAPKEVHLDVIYKNFAKDRNVNPSLSLDTFIKAILNKMDILPIISVHIMASKEDLKEVKTNLHNLYNSYPSDKIAAVYLPLNYPREAGVWYDLGQYSANTNFHKNNKKTLLMTVKAGLSGQKAQDKDKQLALEIARKIELQNGQGSVILDGGWKIEESHEFRTVSYGDFWSSFGPSVKNK